MQNKRKNYNALVFEKIKTLEINTRENILRIISNIVPNNEWETCTKITILFATGLFTESNIEKHYYNGNEFFPELHNNAYFFTTRTQSPSIYILLKEVEEIYLKKLNALNSEYIPAKKRL